MNSDSSLKGVKLLVTWMKVLDVFCKTENTIFTFMEIF